MDFSFETEGFSVRMFASGEALLAEEALPAYGCLVLDQALPGLGGLETLEALRRRGVRLPAILVTTSSPDMLLRARAAGVPLVEKPLMANALLEAVWRQLGLAKQA
jgi:FixJ family two-component response regulator